MSVRKLDRLKVLGLLYLGGTVPLLISFVTRAASMLVASETPPGWREYAAAASPIAMTLAGAALAITIVRGKAAPSPMLIVLVVLLPIPIFVLT